MLINKFMISVRIYGFKDDPKLKTLMRGATFFALQELMPKKRKLNLIIKRVPNLLEKEHAFGLCYSTYDEYTFYIDLYGGQDLSNLIKTLFHEITHVKQFSKRELVYDQPYDSWKGKKYKSNECEYNRPWEKEARKMEKKLFEKFVKYHCL